MFMLMGVFTYVGETTGSKFHGALVVLQVCRCQPTQTGLTCLDVGPGTCCSSATSDGSQDLKVQESLIHGKGYKIRCGSNCCWLQNYKPGILETLDNSHNFYGSQCIIHLHILSIRTYWSSITSIRITPFFFVMYPFKFHGLITYEIMNFLTFSIILC